MRNSILENLRTIKIIETKYGYSIVGYKESILPIGKLARILYKKKLKTRRLIKKYAKKLVEDAIHSALKGVLK